MKWVAGFQLNELSIDHGGLGYSQIGSTLVRYSVLGRDELWHGASCCSCFGADAAWSRPIENLMMETDGRTDRRTKSSSVGGVPCVVVVVVNGEGLCGASVVGAVIFLVILIS